MIERRGDWMIIYTDGKFWPLGVDIQCWSPDEVELQFLEMFHHV